MIGKWQGLRDPGAVRAGTLVVRRCKGCVQGCLSPAEFTTYIRRRGGDKGVHEGALSFPAVTADGHEDQGMREGAKVGEGFLMDVESPLIAH
jgi:hypothetical protein